MSRLLLVVTNHSVLGSTGKQTGAYLPEVAHPYYTLLEAGFQLDFASPKGGASVLDQDSVNYFKNDPECKRFLEDKHALELFENTLSPKEIVPKNYKLVLFCGGHGSVFDFPYAEDLLSIAAQVYEANGYIAAVCHGPGALVNIKLSNGEYLLKGLEATGFSNEEETHIQLDKVVPFLLEDVMH
jgi:putative intracellular protease/amidase